MKLNVFIDNYRLYYSDKNSPFARIIILYSSSNFLTIPENRTNLRKTKLNLAMLLSL